MNQKAKYDLFSILKCIVIHFHIAKQKNNPEIEVSGLQAFWYCFVWMAVFSNAFLTGV